MSKKNTPLQSNLHLSIQEFDFNKLMNLTSKLLTGGAIPNYGGRSIRRFKPHSRCSFGVREEDLYYQQVISVEGIHRMRICLKWSKWRKHMVCIKQFFDLI